MQVLFLLYHYFEAKEVYNAIRVFIAGYVWMTGFGNFSYYYKTGDFAFPRYDSGDPDVNCLRPLSKTTGHMLWQ